MLERTFYVVAGGLALTALSVGIGFSTGANISNISYRRGFADAYHESGGARFFPLRCERFPTDIVHRRVERYNRKNRDISVTAVFDRVALQGFTVTPIKPRADYAGRLDEIKRLSGCASSGEWDVP